MKFPENWLRQHVPTSATRDGLVDTLTAIGLEVEEVTPLGEGLDGVVVAEIISADKHPEADRLQVCRVDAGDGTPVQVVCGAPNARVGLKAPFARVGAVLPGGMKLEAAKLRGVESFGMLCSARELGTDSDAAGLLELPADARPGQPIEEVLGLPDSTIEIKLTPNRADCFSVRGIAFDVAAASGCEAAPFAVEPVPAGSEAMLPIRLSAGGDAPRYCGRVIEGVDTSSATPWWMAERLRRSGVRPVSLLVDVTQYVMLELGQPMHAFDRDTLSGPVGVRRGRAGESMVLLDGRRVELDDGYLLVTDDDRPVALAGIMGGQDTRVTAGTRNVFLESAHFAPSAVIGRSRKLGLHTDAAHRFERGVDPALPRTAIEYATRLILDIAGGTPGPVTEAVQAGELPCNTPILLRRRRLARVLGLEVADAAVERILRALDMRVEPADGGWLVTAPSRRFDVALEEDLIEEIARIHGYDHVPATLPRGATVLRVPAEERVGEPDVRRHLASRGFLEAINYAFVEAGLLARWEADGQAVPLLNPLSAELGVMRSMLLPGLVSALGRNTARQQSRVRLFELGNVFTKAAVDGEPPVERLRVAATASGTARAEQWSEDSRPVGFHDLKGDLESLAALSRARLEFRPSAPAWAHPGRSADVFLGGAVQPVGWIGELHPRLLEAMEVDTAVVAFELDLEPLLQRALPRAGVVSRQPSVRRDLAFVLPVEAPWAAVESSIRGAAGEILRDLVLFDRYQGKGVESGFKSLAMGLILQEESRTLTDREVDAAVAAVSAALQRDHGAVIRG